MKLFDFFRNIFRKKTVTKPSYSRVDVAIPQEMQIEQTGIVASSIASSIPVVPTNSIHTLRQFISKNKNKMMLNKFILSELTKSIKKDYPRTELFRIGNTPIVARIDKENYEKTLVEIRDFFIKEQEFEHADQTQQLIQKHQVNAFLK